MNSFDEIIEKIKDIISSEVPKRRVFDTDVAKEIGVLPATLASAKKRNSILYREIMLFCAKRKICINWLFFNQDAEALVVETEKFSRSKHFVFNSLNKETTKLKRRVF